MESSRRKFQRISRNILPVRYNLVLEPNLLTCGLRGSAEIDVQVLEQTKTVELNANKIKIDDDKIKFSGGDFQQVGSVRYDDGDEKIIVTFDEELKIGDGTLHIDYSGQLGEDLRGFYRYKYETPSGEERNAAVTQFEPINARMAFPCWDEPSFKATFDISLKVPKDRVALSNMPVKKETMAADGNLKVVEFIRTPVMSTYLIAFVVGDFDYVEGHDVNGLLHRVYTPSGKKHLGEFALKASLKTIPFYADYFGIAYPLPKLDLIGIADITGAMENFGLVTFREKFLLIDPISASADEKQTVATLIGHEMAHMWFGDLVTMDWWTDLWLKEGFANFMMYYCVDHIFPEMDFWTSFVNEDLFPALSLDALSSSHPIEVDVGHPSEIDQIFDSISYCKGCSVIKMLQDYVGAKDFREGLKVYLKRHQYKNTRTVDLWSALEETSGKPVGRVMETWTKQMGFPLVSVSIQSDDRAAASTSSITLTISQEPFSADSTSSSPGGGDGTGVTSSALYLVPINIATKSSSVKPGFHVKSFLLEDRSTSVTIDNVPSGDWIKLNPGAVGFYRTRYDKSLYDNLLSAVRDKSLAELDRLSLLNDSYALARACKASSADLLSLMLALSKVETNFSVWLAFSSIHVRIGRMIQEIGGKDLDNWTLFTKRLFTNIYQSVGWTPKTDEGHCGNQLRQLVILKMGAAVREEDVVKEAKRRFADHVSKKQLIPSDLLAAVCTVTLRNGGEKELNDCLKLIDEADGAEKTRLLELIGSVSDEKLIQRVLDYSLSEAVRAQDTVAVIESCTHSLVGRQLAWKFVSNNWPTMTKRYKLFMMPYLLTSTVANFCSASKLQEIKDFFKANPHPPAERAINQSIENIEGNIRWFDRDIDEIKAFVKANI